MTRFHFISLFPQVIEPWLTTSILGRAHQKGLFDFELIQLRDFSVGPHRSVDDVAYGGGGGMVLRPEPLTAAVESVWQKYGKENCTSLYFSPAGVPMSQLLLESCAETSRTKPHWILICGHYEGIDERFRESCVDLEISLGDFVLTGGELPAVAFVDALARQLGALEREGAHEKESFALRDPQTGDPLLEYPQYTRPSEFRGKHVPEVLLSGNHKAIADWRMKLARKETVSRRPDLVKSRD